MYCTVRTVPLFLVSHLSTRQSEGTSRPRPPLPNKWSPNKVIRPYMQKMDAIRDKIILYRETFNFCVRKNTKSWAILATKFSHRVHIVKGEKYSTNIPHQIAWNFLCNSLQTRRRDYHDYQVSRVHKQFSSSRSQPIQEGCCVCKTNPLTTCVPNARWWRVLWPNFRRWEPQPDLTVVRAGRARERRIT